MNGKRTDLAAFYFPNYHADPRNNRIHHPGWSEWELVKAARPRFPGHQQPKVPLWEYADESRPEVMARKIDAAADYGLAGFLFDWYWYDECPFLEGALTDGFQAAANCRRLKYALMWANHDWHDIHPMNRAHEFPLLFKGGVTEEQFDRMTDYVIARHFLHPSYWLIDRSPWFIIYEVCNFVESIGGWDKARRALARFRAKVRDAGFADLHLTLVLWGCQILPGERVAKSPEDVIRLSGAQSVTSYVWTHHITLPDFPFTEYEMPYRRNVAYWHESRLRHSVPYFPNVTMGWDSSPRTPQDEEYRNCGYPFCPVMKTTPGQFEVALRESVAFVSPLPDGKRIVTVNAWNEWTEGSYLEPDTLNGYGYLEAIRRVMDGGDAHRRTNDQPDGSFLSYGK
ncbi:MAG: glycoside hydrolase family 99-like domain-containing protein [Victivallales bacterium]|nr:glycoside hydrolase family 99-like domain-containing protein [Victivallales bacterium]